MGLRILHVTEDFSLDNTGITSSLENLVGLLKPHVEWVGIYSTGGSTYKTDLCDCFHCDREYSFPNAWKYPAGFKEHLTKVITKYNVNILHIHGVWLAAPYIATQCSKEMDIPSILSVHGQMEPSAIKNQSKIKEYKKRLYWNFIGKRSIKNVTALHAITELENKHMLEYLPGKPVEVIPNALNIQDYSEHPDSNLKPVLFFLGRINPIKNLDSLIKAFSKAKISNDWSLVIAGPNEVSQYKNYLDSLIDRLMLKERVKIIGPVYDDEKMNLLRSSWALVLPSSSEVIGMVNLEAGACFLPSITTKSTGLDDWENGGGILIENSESELTSAIETVCSWSIPERISKGEESYMLIKEKYSNDAVGGKWLDYYNKVVDISSRSSSI